MGSHSRTAVARQFYRFDQNLTYSDDSTVPAGMLSAVFALNTYIPGEDKIELNVTGTGISLSDGYAPGSQVFLDGTQIATIAPVALGEGLALKLAASADPSGIQALMRALAYVSKNPSGATAGLRTIFTRVSDAGGQSISVKQTLKVPVPPSHLSAPVVELNAMVSFIEPYGPLYTNLDKAVVLSDPDSETLASATVTISQGYAPGKDTLAVNERMATSRRASTVRPAF